MKVSTNRSQSRRVRRGATILFVALFAVALVALAAFAIDISRLYVGANELQTGADASALRGALHMQYSVGANPTLAVTAFAPANEALSQPLAVANAAVRPVVWTPGSGADTVSATWATANAVQVTAERTTGLLFGKVLSAVAPSPKRRAIAWVANIVSFKCPAPWGFPLAGLNNVLYSQQDFTVRSDMFGRISQQLASPNGALGLTMVMHPGSTSRPTPANYSWPFQGINDAGNANMNEYADQVAGASCAANRNTTIGQTESFPGAGQGSVPAKTAGGAFGAGITNGEQFCAAPTGGRKGAPVADCFPIGAYGVGTGGVDRYVSWTGLVTSGSATVLTLGAFRVMCVFSGRPNGSSDPGERCAWYDQWRASSFGVPALPASLPPGTIVGYPVGTFPNLGNDELLGTAPSLAQRLILVR